MKIGVLGYRGFIGSNLVLAANVDFEFVAMDIDQCYDNDFIRSLDAIINAIGKADVAESFLNPYSDFLSNTELVYRVLDCILKSNKKIKFINLSSAAVYGNPKNLPVNIDEPPNPISPYGFNKFLSENILSSFYEFFLLPTVSVRIFSCYGIGNKKQVLWDLCNKAASANGGELVVLGNESNTRDFIHISDLINQLKLILLFNDFQGKVLNIGSGEQTSIGFVSNIIAKQFSCSDVKFTGESKLGYPLMWQADVNWFFNRGFKILRPIELGIIEYCLWYKKVI